MKKSVFIVTVTNYTVVLTNMYPQRTVQDSNRTYSFTLIPVMETITFKQTISFH